MEHSEKEQFYCPVLSIWPNVQELLHLSITFSNTLINVSTVQLKANNDQVYLRPLFLFLPPIAGLSAPLVSAPLSSSPLTALSFLPDLVFLMWCSGIHSSWYPPAPVAVTEPTGALTVSTVLGRRVFLDVGGAKVA